MQKIINLVLLLCLIGLTMVDMKLQNINHQLHVAIINLERADAELKGSDLKLRAVCDEEFKNNQRMEVTTNDLTKECK